MQVQRCLFSSLSALSCIGRSLFWSEKVMRYDTPRTRHHKVGRCVCIGRSLSAVGRVGVDKTSHGLSVHLEQHRNEFVHVR
ncbi:uncharacterized protein K452DRAFT_166040 [Aplosporella prunicola CBS 121167]|uniref:Uncharacterized protein n=1 Tax=Aplosporella prunicola CBS 121167 TaxID=1176127 RepID=A0A6A6AXJ1_9PEZI|nr:uncharacterized protein K452DRAFT_166040 [Aplosporella prunicola CBS 121167]KAF2135705.1 hypothetical protein K452DRAFT_166040 [Aplosporella prunicola CBS 121167]